jgi:ADP-ribosylglycohydrolase
MLDKIKGVLFGVAIGDALGVPVEFEDRHYLKENPVNGFIGYGTHNQPPGTFSDDASLTFCLAEVLTGDFNLNAIANNFVKWAYENYWTSNGKVFDIGISTRKALDKITKGIEPELAGGNTEYDNGNGALMRISPLIFYIFDKPADERFKIVQKVVSITHRHIQSVISCFYYLEFMLQLLQGKEKFEIYENLKSDIPNYLNEAGMKGINLKFLDPLLKYDIYNFPEEQIESDGFVVHTLEASVWCFLNTKNYSQAVIKAVNLGDDTDTTGAVVGGLAGLQYGYANIPAKWVEKISRAKDIEDLAERMGNNIHE